ncbi:hypothetical protein [Novosphingobium guangzhouense]|uniref:Uncharacterized protein n=1 Tax=Novosphingobium guangzhouense TaxID=1850347 RepID=A0A2K2G482_9SPHN|nr:hypothetical protein [Novosphingobium guangzhouense]PNU05850.1 hypothetical protein A8V01_14920 [Novosphingobium guangzhouense]
MNIDHPSSFAQPNMIGGQTVSSTITRDEREVASRPEWAGRVMRAYEASRSEVRRKVALLRR